MSQGRSASPTDDSDPVLARRRFSAAPGWRRPAASICGSPRTRPARWSSSAGTAAGSASCRATSIARWGWPFSGPRMLLATRHEGLAPGRLTRAGPRFPGGTAGAVRRALPTPGDLPHGRYQRPRRRVRRRRALARQHAVLLPGRAGAGIQLPAAVGAAVHHRVRPGRSLPPQRPGHGRRDAPLRHRLRGHRHGGRLARGAALRGDRRRRPERRGRRARALHAPLAPAPRGGALAAGVRQGRAAEDRPGHLPGRGRLRPAGLRPGPGLRRPVRG